jgi:hypothetical protein
MRTKWGKVLFTLPAILWSGILLACPLCAENMSKDVYGRQPTQLGQGFFWSIIFMMALPFLTVATVGTKIYLAKRRRSAPEAKSSS